MVALRRSRIIAMPHIATKSLAGRKGLPFPEWCRREAKRQGVRWETIKQRVRMGFYTGMKLFRQSRNRVFVVKAGRCRKFVSSNALRRGSESQPHPTPHKYHSWLQAFDCGGMTPRRDGSY